MTTVLASNPEPEKAAPSRPSNPLAMDLPACAPVCQVVILELARRSRGADDLQYDCAQVGPATILNSDARLVSEKPQPPGTRMLEGGWPWVRASQ